VETERNPFAFAQGETEMFSCLITFGPNSGMKSTFTT